MKASNTNSTSYVPTWHSNSPVPYLFGGLCMMVALIAAALIVLACSLRKRPGSVSQDDKPIRRPSILPLDPEPRIVVIMAGDDLPSFLAMPARMHPDAKTPEPHFPSIYVEQV